jgi:tetratricopeptide (TPR) repeat protein
MKVLIKISVLVITVLFLTVGFCYGQDFAEQFRRSCYSKGVEHAVKGNFIKAKEEFEKVLEFDPYYESAKRAVKVIEDTLDQKIKNTTAIHLLKGIGYEEKELWDDSISEFNLAIEINPRYAEVYCIRSIIFLVKGQYDNAISDCNKAIEINPKCAWAYNNRGIAYNQGKGQHDKAFSDLTKAIELNPIYADAYNNRGIVYAIKGQFVMACSDWRRAWELGLFVTYELAKRNGDCK